MDKSHSFSNALELQESIRDEYEYELRGFDNKSVAYAWLWDFETGIRANTPSHPWVFLESDEDFYSIAFTRSTTADPNALFAPHKLFARSHTDHSCTLIPELNKDASIYFIRKYRLTPTKRLFPKIHAAQQTSASWEKRIEAISTNGKVCVEANSEIRKMIRICANARKRA